MSAYNPLTGTPTYMLNSGDHSAAAAAALHSALPGLTSTASSLPGLSTISANQAANLSASLSTSYSQFPNRFNFPNQDQYNSVSFGFSFNDKKGSQSISQLRAGSEFTASDPSSADSSNLDQSSSPSLLSPSGLTNPFAHITSATSQAGGGGGGVVPNQGFDPMSAYKSYTSSYVNGQQGTILHAINFNYMPTS